MRRPVWSASLALVLALAPGAPPAAALELARALADAASANPALLARRAEVDAARHRIGPAGAWPNPMLEGGVINVPVGGDLDDDPMTMTMVGLVQRLPIAGARGLERRSATAAAEVEAAAAERAHWAVLAATWEAYADAYHAGERAAFARSHAGVMDRLVQSARARYGSGSGRLEEVLRAEAVRARTIADAVVFEAEELAARLRLDALRGVDPGVTVEALEPPPAGDASALATAGVTAVPAASGGDPAIAAHPRLRALDAQAERWRQAASASRRMLWPELEVRASYGFRAEEIPGGMFHGLPVGPQPQDDMYSVTASLMLPVFMVQRELAEGAEMDAMARAAQAERRGAELELRSEIAAALAVERAAARTVALLADTVVVTQRRALDASLAAYAAGTTDLWRTLESAHALYDETLALTRARQQHERTRASLLAIGAGLGAATVGAPAPAGGPR